MPLCTQAGCHFSCVGLCDPMDCSPPGSSVHGILQARILEWAAIPFSRGSSPPRDGTSIPYVSCIGRLIPYHQHHLGSPSCHCRCQQRNQNLAMKFLEGKTIFLGLPQSPSDIQRMFFQPAHLNQEQRKGWRCCVSQSRLSEQLKRGTSAPPRNRVICN